MNILKFQKNKGVSLIFGLLILAILSIVGSSFSHGLVVENKIIQSVKVEHKLMNDAENAANEPHVKANMMNESLSEINEFKDDSWNEYELTQADDSLAKKTKTRAKSFMIIGYSADINSSTRTVMLESQGLATDDEHLSKTIHKGWTRVIAN